MKIKQTKALRESFGMSEYAPIPATTQEIHDVADEIHDFIDLMAHTICAKNNIAGMSQGMCAIQRNKKTSNLHMYVGVTLGADHRGYTAKHSTLEDCERAAYSWINQLAASYVVAP